MPDQVPMLALAVAAVAAIIGLLFYRSDILTELRRKSRSTGAGDVSAPGAPADHGCDAGGAGSDGG